MATPVYNITIKKGALTALFTFEIGQTVKYVPSAAATPLIGIVTNREIFDSGPGGVEEATYVRWLDSEGHPADMSGILVRVQAWELEPYEN